MKDGNKNMQLDTPTSIDYTKEYSRFFKPISETEERTNFKIFSAFKPGSLSQNSCSTPPPKLKEK